MEADENYSLFQSDIIDRLGKRDWFIECVKHNFLLIGKEWACNLRLSERRLGEAYDFWQADVSRALTEGTDEETKDLDHFKHAAFITFWLRRSIPINSTLLRGPLSDRQKGVTSNAQRTFMKYGSELGAVIIGFRICLFYEANLIEYGSASDTSNVRSIFSNTEEYLRCCKIDKKLLADIVMILKHKNMSPHAIYLVFLALFRSIIPNQINGQRS